MRQVFLLLAGLFICYTIEAQTYNFVSTSNNFTDLNNRVITLNETCNFTFDFTNKTITMKINNPTSKTEKVYKYNMLKSERRESLVLGMVNEIYVKGDDLPRLKGVEIFKFKDSWSMIWIDGPAGTFTYSIRRI